MWHRYLLLISRRLDQKRAIFTLGYWKCLIYEPGSHYWRYSGPSGLKTRILNDYVVRRIFLSKVNPSDRSMSNRTHRSPGGLVHLLLSLEQVARAPFSSVCPTEKWMWNQFLLVLYDYDRVIYWYIVWLNGVGALEVLWLVKIWTV